ncbi:MAG: serine protease [Anaerolineales bacterium]|nr:MAG: serine protease [Anaerolineales bacterium]
MTEEAQILPAHSQPFLSAAIRQLTSSGPMAEITPEWAWGGSTGQGVKVAIVDTGVEYDHPALSDMVCGGVIIEWDESVQDKIRHIPDLKPSDVAGHGTACAAIIHSIAPQALLYSVRVLGTNMNGRAYQFAAGVDWAMENGMDVVNLSLSTSKKDYFALFHSLSDEAYFKNVMLVSAASNFDEPSMPSLYSSVFSVASHAGKDPFTYYYNPTPPVEFGAPGIDLRVAWKDHSYVLSTGNSFAAPHIAGIITLIRAKHPELTPFQVKSVLWACAANVRRE